MSKRKRARIFLSYVHRDRQRVVQLYDRLCSAGFNPWMDKEDLLAGEHWRAGIERAIRESDFFIACLSSESINRRGFLQREIKNALDIWREKLPDDIYLIPVRLEDCKVPEALSDFQWVNYFEKDGWEKLLRSVHTGLGRRGVLPDPKASSESVVVTQPKLVKQPASEVQAQAPPEVHRELPLVTFPRELSALCRWLSPAGWEQMDDAVRRFLITLGIKLEPIVQIMPPAPVPVVTGFECLALGALGENFTEISRMAAGVNPGHLRLLLALAAMKTAENLRIWASEDGNTGAHRLIFTVNLDPETLDCPRLEEFLDRYRHIWEKNFLFEISEKTSISYLQRLKDLQVDFNLRYSADDYNAWHPEAQEALKSRVEMSKVDNDTFHAAMAQRSDDPKGAIQQLRAHLISNKPLVVEGVESENYLRFLKNFGLPGGHILNAMAPDTPTTLIEPAGRRRHD